ncbi:hypothetical protein DPMN_015412 [Dreissena polymorpha]|uniref:Uncharacterized protein n=1 Tax=Dreissena polymorpha TaxID=45954 RepID=A0A9D4N7Q0_DREPO|nr:hypothetical protein DPMN_015412 [Dreissena polymorpha]
MDMLDQVFKWEICLRELELKMGDLRKIQPSQQQLNLAGTVDTSPSDDHFLKISHFRSLSLL